MTGSLILPSHNFLNFCASLNFLQNFDGIGAMILFFKNAFTSLSEVFSIESFHFYQFNNDIGSSLV